MTPLFVSLMTMACDSPGGEQRMDTSDTHATETVAEETPDAEQLAELGAEDSSETSGETSAQEDTALVEVSDDDTLSACDRDGLGALVSESYELQEYPSYDGHSYLGGTASGELLQVLLIEPVTTGRFALGDSFEDCRHCVFIGARCGADTCAEWYVATSGELLVTRLDEEGGRMEGRISGVTLVEHIEDPDAETWVPKPGGRTWCVSSATFGADIPAVERSYRLLPQTSQSPIIGDTEAGGTLRESKCPFGLVSVGIDGTWYEEEGESVVDSVRLRCVDPLDSPLGGFADVAPRIGTPGYLALEAGSRCPDGQLMVGVEAAFLPEADAQILAGVAARCADIGPWVDTGQSRPEVSTGWWAGVQGSARAECPRGAAMVALRADAVTRDLGFGTYVRIHTLRAVCQNLEAR